jgi:hypothetical protein
MAAKIALLTPDKDFNSDRVLREIYATKSEVDIIVAGDEFDRSAYPLLLSAKCDVSGVLPLRFCVS